MITSSEPPEEDRALLERARAGDEGALRALLERHQEAVYRFGMRMCGDPEDAKDVLQETLLAMARGVRDFRGASSLSTWLYTIARRFCSQRRRRGRREMDARSAAGEAVLGAPARSPEDAVAGRRIAEALERAIGALEPAYREVLVLRDVEGLTAPEVAEVLGIGAQAVKSRLHRARLSVRAELAPLLEPASEVAAPGTCPDVLTLLSQHLEGEISAETCAEMKRHLDDCPRCSGACASLERTLALCHAAPAVPVPEDVQAAVRIALRDLLAEKV